MAGLALRKRFTCFKRLPLEVRLLIWEAALPGPRLVSIRQRQLRKIYLDYKEEKGHEWPPMEEQMEGSFEEYDLDDKTQEDRNEAREAFCQMPVDVGNMQEFWQTEMLGIDSDCRPPNIMYTCREAYEVVSRKYTKAFAYPDNLPATYFNFDTDILYLHENNFSRYNSYLGNDSTVQGLAGDYTIADRGNLWKVQNLAVHVTTLYQTPPIEGFLSQLLNIFRGVRSLTLVARDDNSDNLLDYSDDTVEEGCFIEPVDARGAIRAYSLHRQELLEGHRKQLKIPKHHNVALFEQAIELVRQIWESAMEAIFSPPEYPAEFPKIRITNIVPRLLKRDLDQAKALYKQGLTIYEVNEEIRKREELHAAGFCTDDALSDDDF